MNAKSVLLVVYIMFVAGCRNSFVEDKQKTEVKVVTQEEKIDKLLDDFKKWPDEKHTEEELIKIGKPIIGRLYEFLKDKNDQKVTREGHFQGPKRIYRRDWYRLPDQWIDTTYMWQVRLESVKVLDKIGEEETIAPLIYAIDDPNILVSDAAAEALGKRKERRAVGSLIKAIKNRDFPYAVKALGEIGDERAIKPLLEELKNEERANKYDLHTSYVKEALIKIGRQVVPYVIDELKKGNKSFKIKRHMIEILGEIGDNRAVLVLIEIVEENIPGIFENGSYAKVEKWEEYIFIKMDAAEALGNIGDERAIPCIEELSKKYVVGPNQIGMSFRIECDRALKKIISNKKLQ